MRTNSRPVARAIDSPIDVLPVPGGPISVRIAPERRSSAIPRSVRSFLTAMYSVMRSLTSSRPKWSASSTSRACCGSSRSSLRLRPRHGDQPVQVGADHLALAAFARALEPAELALGLLADVVGHAGFLDLRAVLVDDRAVVLAELAADRLHLLAQHVLALLLGGAGLDVLADAAADLELGQALALELEREVEALGDVERLEQADLLLESEVGRVAGGVGQGAGLGDRAHERGDAPVVAAVLEDLLDGGAVLALELARAAVDRDVVGVLGDLHAQAAA